MPFSLLVALILLLIVVAAEPQVMLFLLSLGYVISGPVTMVMDRRKKSALKSVHRHEGKVAGESGLTGRR
jgi:CDP-diacylglycerol--serine O-phosphatidyltransferase